MTTKKYTTMNSYNRKAETSMGVGHARSWAMGFRNNSDCEGWLAELPRKRRGAHAPSRAVSGAPAGNVLRPPLTTAPECLRRGRQRRHARARVLPNAGKMPALLEAGTSRMPASH
jgi:hypothetical protein